jgi:hypothetical protein
MTETDRQQTVVERILEDESLRGELEDPAATALINWASERAGAIAADPSRSDQAVDAAVQAIRMAVRQAASSGEQDPERVVALAEAALAKQAPSQASEIAEAAPSQPPAVLTAAEPQPDAAESTTTGGVPDQNDATAPTHPAEGSTGAATKAPTSKRRRKRRQRSRRKSK